MNCRAECAKYVMCGGVLEQLEVKIELYLTLQVKKKKILCRSYQECLTTEKSSQTPVFFSFNIESFLSFSL